MIPKNAKKTIELALLKSYSAISVMLFVSKFFAVVFTYLLE